MKGLDKWITTTPEDKAHKPECCCIGCHEGHKQNGDVEYNATKYPQDYKCCLEEYEDMQACCQGRL